MPIWQRLGQSAPSSKRRKLLFWECSLPDELRRPYPNAWLRFYLVASKIRLGQFLVFLPLACSHGIL